MGSPLHSGAVINPKGNTAGSDLAFAFLGETDKEEWGAPSLSSRIGLRLLASRSSVFGLRSLASRLGLRPLASRLGLRTLALRLCLWIPTSRLGLQTLVGAKEWGALSLSSRLCLWPLFSRLGLRTLDWGLKNGEHRLSLRDSVPDFSLRGSVFGPRLSALVLQDEPSPSYIAFGGASFHAIRCCSDGE
jgi:hypothetical protein